MEEITLYERNCNYVGEAKESTIKEKKVLYKGKKELDGHVYNMEIALKLGRLILSASGVIDTIIVEIPVEKSNFFK